MNIVQSIISCHSCPTSLSYGTELLKRLKIQEYLIILNKNVRCNNKELLISSTVDQRICRVIDYINQHIQTDLSIAAIAHALYISPSYLMHLFKKETGYTIGQYISDKRLFLANQLITAGRSITEACYLSGYQNYGAFYHAYKARYGASPRSCLKNLK